MAERSNDRTRTELLQLLLDKVEEDQYPSSTMLDLVEHLLHEEDVEMYADLLMSKIKDEDYPSNSLIRRLTALV